MNITVLAPVTAYEKEFNTIDEFNVYYMKNRDDFNKQTTNMLNKKFHINGYKITKIKGELCLRKFDPSTDKKYISKDELRSSLQKQIDEVKQSVNKIIQYITRTEQSFVNSDQVSNVELD